MVGRRADSLQTMIATDYVQLEALLRRFRDDEDGRIAESIEAAPTLASAAKREEYSRAHLNDIDFMISFVHARGTNHKP